MTWGATADPARFDEAADWFAARNVATRAQVDLMTAQQRSRAFWVSAGLDLKSVQIVFDELQRAIDEGKPLEDFQRRVREKLGAVSPSGAHLETVMRTNVQTAYNTGRWQQMNDPSVIQLRPFWMFDAVLDSRTTPICTELDATVRAADDPVWLQYWPPLHHRCRSSVRSLTRGQAERRGITEGAPGLQPPGDFGQAPPVRGETPPDRSKFAPEVWDVYQKRVTQAANAAAEINAAEAAARTLGDPAHWLQQAQNDYGADAAPAVAWGRAMEHRGRAITYGEAEKRWAALTKGMRNGADPTLFRENLFGLFDDALGDVDKPATLGGLIDKLAELVPHDEDKAHQRIALGRYGRACASVLGHVDSIQQAGSIALQSVTRVANGAATLADARKGQAVARRFFERLSDASIVQPTSMQWRVTKNRRAGFHVFWIEMGKGSAESQIHEWGHALEHLNPRLHRQAVGFLRTRTAGETPQQLSALLNASYGPSEVATPDRLFDAYMGKRYQGDVFTEITSMGAQFMYASPATVLQMGDDDSLAFLLGQLAGDALDKP